MGTMDLVERLGEALDDFYDFDGLMRQTLDVGYDPA